MQNNHETLRWQEALRQLDSASVVCYDVETSGLDWKRNHPVGHVLTFGPSPDASYYLPVRHKAGGNLMGFRGPQEATSWDESLHPIEAELIEKLDRPGLLVFGHNIGFDLKFLWRLGCRLQARYEDTQINAPLLDEYLGKYNLLMCSQRAGIEAKKVELIRGHIKSKFPEAGDRDFMSHYWRLAGDDPIVVEYAEGDGVTTWQLRDWQTPQLVEQELTKVHGIESRLIPVLARMTIKGIRIDEERLDWVIRHLDREIDELMAGFLPSFNPRSPDDVKAWCERHGSVDWPLTQKLRKPSFPESWLLTNEAGQKVVAVRKFMTLRDSYIIPLRDEHLFEGRVHTEFNQLKNDDYGTITGRLSSSNPNLQQASKRDPKMGRLHRSPFVPDEGQLWGSDDWKQMEPRLLAHYSGCRVLVAGYTSDPEVDAHTAVAQSMFDKWEGADKAAQKAMREVGKRINQTLITGGGKGVITERYGIDPATVSKQYDAYFKAMPEVRDFQREAGRVLQRRGYVVSLLGRRAHFKDVAYVAVNRLLQCGNADAIKLKMVEIDDYLASEGRPIDMLINIHDAIESQFRPEDRKHRTEMLRIMEDFGPNSVMPISLPVKVDAGEGRNWAEATFGVEEAGK